MEPVIKNELSAFWRKRELEIGRIITIQEVAKATKLNWETVEKLKEGKTQRYDAHVLARICHYLGVPAGQPVPFLIVEMENS